MVQSVQAQGRTVRVVDPVWSVARGNDAGTQTSVAVVLDDRELLTAVVGTDNAGPASLFVAAPRTGAAPGRTTVTATCMQAEPTDNGAGVQFSLSRPDASPIVLLLLLLLLLV